MHQEFMHVFLCFQKMKKKTIKTSPMGICDFSCDFEPFGTKALALSRNMIGGADSHFGAQLQLNQQSHPYQKVKGHVLKVTCNE